MTRELGATELQRSVLGGRQGQQELPRGEGCPNPSCWVQDRVHELHPALPSVLAVAFPFVSMEQACGLAHPAEHVIGCWISVPVGSVAVQCVVHSQFT